MSAMENDKAELCKNMELDSSPPYCEYEENPSNSDQNFLDLLKSTRVLEASPPMYEDAVKCQDDMHTLAAGGGSYPEAQSDTSVIVEQPQVMTIQRSATLQYQVTGDHPPTCWLVLTWLFSCLVFWLFCWPIGCCAIFATYSATTEKNGSASRKKLVSSNVLSGIGLVIGIIIWVIAYEKKIGFFKEDY